MRSERGAARTKARRADGGRRPRAAQTRRGAAALCALTATAAATPALAAGATPAFSPVAGSPFTTIGSPASLPLGGAGGAGPLALAFSPDGALLTTSNVDGTVSEFSVASSGVLAQLAGAVSEPYSPGPAIAWNPAGTVLAAANTNFGESSIQTFVRGTDGQLTAASNGDTAQALDGLAFSPNGKYLAAAVADAGDPQDPGEVDVFAVAANGSLDEVASPTVTSTPVALAFSPSGRDLAVADAGSGTVTVLKVGAFTPVAGSPFTVGSVPDTLAYRPNGTMLAVGDSGDGRVSLQRVMAGGGLTPRGSAGTGGSVNSVAWSPDGELLAAASGTGAGTDSIYRVRGSALTPVTGSPFAVGNHPLSLQFSPDGRFLATANSNDSTVTMLAAAAPACRSTATGTPSGTRVRVQLRCSSPTGERLHYAVTSGPAHGHLGPIDAADGQVTYTPDPGFSGADRFTYTASTGGGTAAPATVVVLVG